MAERLFRFKQFSVAHQHSLMKVGTDSILLGAWTPFHPSSLVLDIGTGCGLLALMMAQRLPAATIHAVELHEESYQEAQQNFATSPWSGRLSAVCQSIQDYALECRHTYDLMISNPPYFNSGVARNSARHTSQLGHKELITIVHKLLSISGKFSLILPTTEMEAFVQKALEARLYLTKHTSVYLGRTGMEDRSLLVFEKQAGECIRSKLSLYDLEGQLSSEYRNLVKEFYL